MENMLAIIPARDGSKGLENKNIKMLLSKPLMAYTIEATIKSKCFKNIMVSTNNKEYGDIAIKYGAEVPFLRSSKTSSNTASSWEVIKEVLENYSQMGQKFDGVTLLQPTSPMRTFEDIIGAYKLFREKNADFVASVCEAEHLPVFSNTLKDDSCMKNFIRKEYLKPRQDFPIYYRLNGAIYILKPNSLEKEYLYDENSYAFIMERNHSIDIDTEGDFLLCENLMNLKTGNNII